MTSSAGPSNHGTMRTLFRTALTIATGILLACSNDANDGGGAAGTGGSAGSAGNAGRGGFNNLIYFARSDLSTYVNVGPNTQAPSFQFANNLWYAHDTPTSSRPTDLPATETNGVVGSDPLLVGPTSGDYGIRSSSPAAGAGQRASELRSDMGGRCYGDPPSIGAHER